MVEAFLSITSPAVPVVHRRLTIMKVYENIFLFRAVGAIARAARNSGELPSYDAIFGEFRKDSTSAVQITEGFQRRAVPPLCITQHFTPSGRSR